MRIEPYLVSIAANVLKRIMEPHYDRLAWHETVQRLRALSGRERRAVELVLYALAACIEIHTSARTPLRDVLKRVLEDAPSEFGNRIVNRPLPPAHAASSRPTWLNSLNRWCERATKHIEQPFF